MLRDPRCLKPTFCREFLDLCDGKALEAPDESAEYAGYAVELAERIGDVHLMHDATGVVVHSLIARQQRAEAAQTLEGYRPTALACCRHCSSEWYRRQGDLLVEDFVPHAAGLALDRSLRQLGDNARGDALGRRCFLRGIQHHFQGEPDRALDAAATALMELSLDSPRGYFLDTLGLIACFLQGHAERRYVERALRVIQRFRPRLKGRRDASVVRTRYRWLEGQLYARLGDFRKAIDRLDRVRGDLSRDAPAKHLVAVTADLGLVLARRVHDVSRRRILTLLRACKARLQDEPEMKKRVHWVIQQASRDNEKAHAALLRLRTSFIVPVPGIVVELPGGRPRRLG